MCQRPDNAHFRPAVLLQLSALQFRSWPDKLHVDRAYEGKNAAERWVIRALVYLLQEYPPLRVVHFYIPLRFQNYYRHVLSFLREAGFPFRPFEHENQAPVGPDLGVWASAAEQDQQPAWPEPSCGCW